MRDLAYDPLEEYIALARELKAQADALAVQIRAGRMVGIGGREYVLNDRDISILDDKRRSLLQAAGAIAKELLPYKYPNKKAVEVSGNLGMSWFDLITASPAELANMERNAGIIDVTPEETALADSAP